MSKINYVHEFSSHYNIRQRWLLLWAEFLKNFATNNVLITCFHEFWIYEFFHEIFFVLFFLKVEVFSGNDDLTKNTHCSPLKNIKESFVKINFRLRIVKKCHEPILMVTFFIRECLFNFSTLVATIRVAKVVAIHNDLLTQWRPIKMSKFHANIFLIRTTSNYFWASEVSKNQVFKSHFFHLPMHLPNE